jgi:ubiquinone biosynthesis protein COQ9
MSSSSSSSSSSTSPSSSSSSSSTSSSNDPRDSILDAALKHISDEGFTLNAISAGAQDIGLRALSAGAFPRGAVELAWHVMRKGNLEMSEAMQRADLESLSVNDRVKLGIKTRLLYQAPLLRSWPQAMALGMQPQNVTETANLLAVFADECWYLAGDRSTNLHWYSRRALLLGVYVATEAYMLSDHSKDFADTWEFLSRRLEDATRVGKEADNALSVASGAGTAIASIAEAGAELLLRPCLNIRDNIEERSPQQPRNKSQESSLVGTAADVAKAVDAVTESINSIASSVGVKLPDPVLVFSTLGAMLPKGTTSDDSGRKVSRSY